MTAFIYLFGLQVHDI